MIITYYMLTYHTVFQIFKLFRRRIRCGICKYINIIYTINIVELLRISGVIELKTSYFHQRGI